MGLFPTRLFGWIEPEAFRGDCDRASVGVKTPLTWLRPTCAFFLAASGAAVGWANKVYLHKDSLMGKPYGFAVAFVGLCLLLYGLPWLLRQLPASVALYSCGLMRTGEQYIFPFQNIAEYRWIENPRYFILQVTTKKGRIKAYGVPDASTRDKIDVLLRGHGVVTGLGNFAPTKP